MYVISDKVINFTMEAMKNWELELTAGGKKITGGKNAERLLQENVLSPLQFETRSRSPSKKKVFIWSLPQPFSRSWRFYARPVHSLQKNVHMPLSQILLTRDRVFFLNWDIRAAMYPSPPPSLSFSLYHWFCTTDINVLALSHWVSYLLFYSHICTY